MTTPYVQNELITPAKMYDRIESRLDALEAAPTVPPFTTVPTASSIVTGANGNPSAAVARDGFIVAVRGLISSTTSWSANSTYTAVVTIPAGFRPGTTIIRYAVGNSATAAARLTLNVNGTVDMLTGTTAPTAIDLSALAGYIAEA